MILNHSDQQYPQKIITLKNTALNNVENFKYLGAFIRYDIPNTGDVEINHRIQMAVSKFVDMSNLLHNVKIHLKTRVVFLNSFIQSRLTYACQNWNVNANQLERLNVTYRKFLRRMVHGGFSYINESENDYRYRINNEMLHDLCGTTDLSVPQITDFKACDSYVSRSCCKNVNVDKYTKKGRPCKTLLEQAVERNGATVDEMCNQALMRN